MYEEIVRTLLRVIGWGFGAYGTLSMMNIVFGMLWFSRAAGDKFGTYRLGQAIRASICLGIWIGLVF